MRKSRKVFRRAGFVTTEYLIVVGVVLSALLAPVHEGMNAVEWLIDAMKMEHSAYIYAASLSELPSVCCEEQ